MYADGATYATNSEYGAISTLCYGVQWDAIMTYLSDVKVGETSYINTINTATTDTAKNIYNISTGVFEWTMEKGSSDNTKIIRGKNNSNEQTAINREEESIDNAGNTSLAGFRVALYIKVPEDLEKYDKSKWKEKYQEVEYIETTGTQCIDTQCMSSSDIDIEMKYQITNIPEIGNNVCLIGSWIEEKLFSIRYYNQKWLFYYGNDIEEPETTILPDNNNHIITTKANKLYIDNNLVITKGELIFNNGRTLSLFAQNNLLSYGRLCSAKAYYLRIYDNDVLVRDFVPCYRKSDNKPGMYDKVNGVFYTNQGTGEFTVGANV